MRDGGTTSSGRTWSLTLRLATLDTLLTVSFSRIMSVEPEMPLSDEMVSAESGISFQRLRYSVRSAHARETGSKYGGNQHTELGVLVPQAV